MATTFVLPPDAPITIDHPTHQTVEAEDGSQFGMELWEETDGMTSMAIFRKEAYEDTFTLIARLPEISVRHFLREFFNEVMF